MNRLVMLSALALSAGTVHGQCTPNPNRFCVTFVGNGYAINGVTKPTLTLVRGETYVFQMVAVSSLHPFHLTTSSTGGGGGAGHYSDGVTPAVGGVSGNQTLTFVVPSDAPDELFYQCTVHAGLGNRITIADPPCAADFNGDGFVDFFDFDEFVQCFEGSACPPGKSADFNGDGFADFFDYDDFVAVFEAGC